MRRRLTLALTPLLIAAGLGTVAAPAAAATSYVIPPTHITGVPMNPQPLIHLVVPLGTISTSLQAGQTAYVYSELTAYDAQHANLIDNEVRCSGVGSGSMVMGENVLPSGDPSRTRITIVTRYLVSAATTGTLTCTIYLRTASTANPDPPVVTSSSETVEGLLKFTPSPVGEDVNHLAMQTSLPAGNIPVSTTVRTPILDRTVPAGTKGVDVIADTEFHRGSSDVYTYSTAKFTLFVNTLGGTGCASATPAQRSEIVPRGVNHAAVPLYTHVTIKPGCERVYAYVKTDYVAGAVGSVGGAAAGLSDTTGSVCPACHTSAMTHMFAVPTAVA